MPGPDPEAEKRRLRSEIRHRFKALPSERRLAWNQTVGKYCTAWLARLRPGWLLLTHPLPDEPDLLEFHAVWERQGWRLAAPRMSSGNREPDLAPVGPPYGWQAGPSGALQPAPTAPSLPPDALAAALIPARAIDRHGNRLGRGGGTFDRLLATLPPSLPRICTLYSFQVMESVPTLPHDQPLQAWLDERGIHSTSLPGVDVPTA